MVVVGGHEKPSDADKAFAYGLAWSGDRDLLVVLPTGTAQPTLRRAAIVMMLVRLRARHHRLGRHLHHRATLHSAAETLYDLGSTVVAAVVAAARRSDGPSYALVGVLTPSVRWDAPHHERVRDLLPAVIAFAALVI